MSIYMYTNIYTIYNIMKTILKSNQHININININKINKSSPFSTSLNSNSRLCLEQKYKKILPLKKEKFQLSKFKSDLIGSPQSLNGRIINIKEYPNLVFIRIDYGEKDTIQTIIDKEKYNQIKKDVSHIKTGQIISIIGEKVLTKTNVESIKVSEYQLLSDCLGHIPKQQYGIKDYEVKYSKRYLDFITNPDSKSIIYQRHLIINYIRQYLINKDFIEVETPILSKTKSGALANPFITNHSALKTDLYLRVAPEIHLKKLIISGFNKIFEIGKNFRNEDISIRHNPEFTSCELYASYWNYIDLLKFTEDFLIDIYEKFYESKEEEVNKIDIKDMKYLDIISILEDKLNVNLKNISEDHFYIVIREYFYSQTRKEKYNSRLYTSPNEEVSNKDIIEDIIENEIETLVDKNPTFLIHHPLILSPLAKRLDEYPLFTERFEVFLNKMEIINAYSELNSSIEQKERFDLLYNNSLYENEGDKDFIEALSYGMPPTGGWGIGIDRLIMILCQMNNIKEVISFPIMNRRI